MALFISEKDGVIEVRQETYGFTKTERSWFYYDMKNRMQSSHGKQGDKPDSPMTESDFNWAQKNYVPNVEPYRQTKEEWIASQPLTPVGLGRIGMQAVLAQRMALEKKMFPGDFAHEKSPPRRSKP